MFWFFLPRRPSNTPTPKSSSHEITTELGVHAALLWPTQLATWVTDTSNTSSNYVFTTLTQIFARKRTRVMIWGQLCKRACFLQFHHAREACWEGDHQIRLWESEPQLTAEREREMDHQFERVTAEESLSKGDVWCTSTCWLLSQVIPTRLSMLIGKWLAVTSSLHSLCLSFGQRCYVSSHV